jgi:signal transduction histidine kinase
MNEEISPPGIALICNTHGQIVRVLRDQLHLFDSSSPGASFLDMLDRASQEKGQRFLETVRTGQAAFEWELNLPINGIIETLFFAGGMIDEDEMVLIGARSRTDIDLFYDELMQINNDQATALRQALKHRALQERSTGGQEEHNLYNELSRLNNELATTQRELAKKNAELQSLNEAKNQLLGMAAHDLRNPLSVIILYSEVLESDVGKVMGLEHQEFIRTIRSSSEQMLRIINDLLDVSKIQAGKLDLKPVPSNLVEIVERNIVLNRMLAERSGVELRFSTRGEIPTMLIDSQRIDQVLNNLVSNAIKFSQSGTTTEVTVSRQNGHVVIAIRDQGPGIPESEREKLFHPYERTSVRSARGEWSSGLGLAIAKRIVDAHGGQIRVESMPGAGSTFFVELPVATQE